MRSFSRSSCVLDRGGADVPGRLRVVHQRRVAAPAVRVACARRRRGGTADRAHADRSIRIWSASLKNIPPTSGSRPGSGRRVPTGLTTGRPLARHTREVVGTERRRLVHQPGAVVSGDVVGASTTQSAPSGSRPDRTADGSRSPTSSAPGTVASTSDSRRAPVGAAAVRRPRTCRRRCGRRRSRRRDAPRQRCWTPASTGVVVQTSRSTPSCRPTDPTVSGKRT